MIKYISNSSFLAGFMSALVLFFALAALMTAGCAESATVEPCPVEPSPTYFVANLPTIPAGVDGHRVTYPEAEHACAELGAELATDALEAARACSEEPNARGWGCWTAAQINGLPVATTHSPMLIFEAPTTHLAFPVCVVY